MLTPMDIHNKDFKRALRGYNTNEVDEFLDRVVSDYEKLFRENDKLKEQTSFNEKEISQYRKLEKNLQDTLMMAQNTADEITSVARKNAEDLTTSAQKSADDITSNARRSADDIMASARQNADELMTTTRKTVEDMKTSTERECNSIREQAKLEAQRRMDEANNKLRSVIAEYEKIVREKNAFLLKFRMALESELAVTNQMLSSVPHQDAIKAQAPSMSALSSVPLPTIAPSAEPAPSSPSPVQPSVSKPKTVVAPSKAAASKTPEQTAEELDKTAVFVKSPRVK